MRSRLCQALLSICGLEGRKAASWEVPSSLPSSGAGRSFPTLLPDLWVASGNNHNCSLLCTYDVADTLLSPLPALYQSYCLCNCARKEVILWPPFYIRGNYDSTRLSDLPKLHSWWVLMAGLLPGLIHSKAHFIKGFWMFVGTTKSES